MCSKSLCSSYNDLPIALFWSLVSKVEQVKLNDSCKFMDTQDFENMGKQACIVTSFSLVPNIATNLEGVRDSAQMRISRDYKTHERTCAIQPSSLTYLSVHLECQVGGLRWFLIYCFYPWTRKILN